MPRGYRCILIAVVGWLSLAAQAPNPPANTQQANTAQAVSNATQNVAPTDDELAERRHRAEYERECAKGDDKRQSDLCAQWKAADAAANAAKWTKWGTWFSGLSGLLVLLALGFAFEANHIARQTARRQLRAYMSLDSYHYERVSDGAGHVEIRCQACWVNSGQTPALAVIDHFAWKEFTGEIPNDFDFPDDPEAPHSGPSAIGPGTRVTTSAKRVPEDVFARVVAKQSRLLFWGWMEYADIFRKCHRTEIAAELELQDLRGQQGMRFVTFRSHSGMDETCSKAPKRVQLPPQQ